MIPAAVSELRTADAVRTRCRSIKDAGIAGDLAHFRLDEPGFEMVVEAVADQIERSYPSGSIPIHGRLNHLRSPAFDAATAVLCAAPSHLVDFVFVSVLLDAGAGATWQFADPQAGSVGRSEGLAFASYRAFEAGIFSSDHRPWSIDCDALTSLDDATLAAAMQQRPGNEIAGFEGRAQLVRQLGRIIGDRGAKNVTELLVADLIGTASSAQSHATVDATSLLAWVLNTFSDLWPGRIELEGQNLGDTWRHRHAGGSGDTAGLVPFHKLSQWLTYSLVEPVAAMGFDVCNLERMTGLAEYRNGGMLLELGAIVPTHDLGHEPLSPASEIVVEWRALTVALLDRVVNEIGGFLPPHRQGLGPGEILEAGTWPLGRRLAFERSPAGEPPIRITSDGTVF